jgi:GNAT superfamily N-acetyltransferase
VILRPAVARDRATVVMLGLQFHAESPYSRLLAVDAERLGAQFDIALELGIVVVAERDNVPGPAGPELVGFIGLAALDHPLSGERFAEEIGWWVAPEYRSGTLGPRLLRWAEDWARQHGCAFLKMSAPAGDLVDDGKGRRYEQTPLGRFYEQRGFRPIETAFFKRVA